MIFFFIPRPKTRTRKRPGQASSSANAGAKRSRVGAGDSEFFLEPVEPGVNFPLSSDKNRRIGSRAVQNVDLSSRPALVVPKRDDIRDRLLVRLKLDLQRKL